MPPCGPVRSFQAYIDQVLPPELQPGNIAIMDNLGSHERPGIRAAIEAVGKSLLYLPSYSPDFIPISNAFPEVKPRYATPRSAPSTACGTPLVASAKSSRPQSAPTTSAQQVEIQTDRKSI